MPFEQIVEEHHIIQFRDASELAYQEVGSILRPFVDESTAEGEQNRMLRLFDPGTAQRRTERVPTNVDNRLNRRARWLIYQDPIESGEYIDQIDIWRQAFDPQSDLLRGHNAAVGRGIDDIILDGMLGDAFEGKRGEKKVVLPAGQTIPADVETPGTDTGMTVFKMRKALQKLAEGFVDLDRTMPFIALTARQHDDLLAFTQVTSEDFNRRERPVLRDGKLIEFLGMRIVRMQRLPLKSGTTDVRLNPVWVEKDVHLGIWSDVRPRMWNDTHRQLTPVIHIDFVGDCRRKQDAGVVVVESKEA